MIRCACQTPNSPFTFTFSHFPFLFTFLAETDSAGLSPQESFSGSQEGEYGAGWNFARWAIDIYASGSSPAAEGAFIKSMIVNTGLHGLANVSSVTGAPVPDMLVYWSLATALDNSTLSDSTTFIPLDPRTTVPSFDLRNIYAGLFTQASFYPIPAPVRPFLLMPGPFQKKATSIPGTGKTYWLLSNGPATIDEQLQLLSGTGGPISRSSGFRVGIIRVQVEWLMWSVGEGHWWTGRGGRWRRVTSYGDDHRGWRSVVGPSTDMQGRASGRPFGVAFRCRSPTPTPDPRRLTPDPTWWVA